MSLVDELRKLQELHRSGGLSDEEFAAAKAAVLAEGGSREQPAGDPRVQAQLEQIQVQNELLRLENHWELERQSHMMSGRYGHRYIPRRGTSILSGLLIVGFGVFWTSMAAGIGGGGVFPLFGLLFIVFGLGMSVYSFAKAGKFERAQAEYQARRNQLIEQQGRLIARQIESPPNDSSR